MKTVQKYYTNYIQNVTKVTNFLNSLLNTPLNDEFSQVFKVIQHFVKRFYRARHIFLIKTGLHQPFKTASCIGDRATLSYTKV